MATVTDLPLRRDKTMIWDGVARRRVNGVATLLDLTGATLRLICRDAAGTEMFVLTSGAPTSDGSITIAADQTADRGEYVVKVEAAATGSSSEFPADEYGYYPYEIEITEASGPVDTLAYGFFQYEPDVR
jgi:hypothetical protein